MPTQIITPSGVIRPELVDGYEARRESRNIVHTILDRSNPDVTFRAPGLRTGTFTCVFPVQNDALTAYAALGAGAVMGINDPEVQAVNMFFVVAGGEMVIRLDDTTRSVWLVEVPFQEVNI